MIDFHSHEQQDEFIYNLFDGKTTGFFLDVAAGHPYIGNNTFTLEKLGWDGFGFDILDSKAYGWNTCRKNNFVQIDATSANFTDFLRNNVKTTVDYISLDVDSHLGNLALDVLHRIVDSGITWKAMTFEHEYHTLFDKLRAPSRRILESLGFIRLFEDVKGWTIGNRANDTEIYEDWWINPKYFDSHILQAQSSKLYTFECVEVIKANRKLNYECTHRCSRSFPSEYTYYWHDWEKHELQEVFKRYPR